MLVLKCNKDEFKQVEQFLFEQEFEQDQLCDLIQLKVYINDSEFACYYYKLKFDFDKWRIVTY